MDCTQKGTFFIVLFLAIIYLGNSQSRTDYFTEAVECIAKTESKVLCRHLLGCNPLMLEEDVDVLNQCVGEQLPKVFPNGVTECPQKKVDSSEKDSAHIFKCMENNAKDKQLINWTDCIHFLWNDCTSGKFTNKNSKKK